MIHLTTHYDFLGFKGLQGTHMNALKSFNSKSVKLTLRGGFLSKYASLAHSAPPTYFHLRNCLNLFQISINTAEADQGGSELSKDWGKCEKSTNNIRYSHVDGRPGNEYLVLDCSHSD